jgi:KUP system potassium uptake protein
VRTIIVYGQYANIILQTTSLGNAYGVCVIMVTFITTCMVSIVGLIVWRFNALLVLLFFLVFGCLDGVYMSSALTKVPNGAWFTLMLALILSSIFILWRFGKEQQWTAEAEDRFPASALLTTGSDGQTRLTQAFGGGEVSTVSGVGIYFDKVGDMIPIVFSQFVRKFKARPEIVVFFHLRGLPVPSIPESERYVVSRTSIPSCYRLTVRHGYTDAIVSPDLGRMVIDQLILLATRGDRSTLSEDNSSASSKQHSPEVQAELDVIESAQAAQIIYIMGKEQMKVKAGSNFGRRWLLELFLWIRENSRTKMASMNIPTENLVEVGFVKVI